MICQLETREGKPGWCGRHNTYHRGHMAERAVDPSPRGERFRELWDEEAKQDGRLASSPFRSIQEARTCLHLGVATGAFVEITSKG